MPKVKAAPSLPPPQIDNPGGAGGYALPSTQAAVAQQQQISNNEAQGQANYQSDPGYQAALNSQVRGNADIQAQLNRQLSQALVNYGSPQLASLLSQYGYTLNPEDAAAAQANYNAGNATLARLDQAHNLGRLGVINSLTAHGLASSGDLGYQTNLVDRGYANNIYDAQQAVLGNINNYEQSALAAKAQYQAAVDAALQQAWQNVIQNPGAYTTSNTPSTPTPTPVVQDNGGGGGGGGGDNTPAPTNDYGGYIPPPAPNTPPPATPSAPYTVSVSANKTGGSANKRQGVFSIH